MSVGLDSCDTIVIMGSTSLESIGSRIHRESPGLEDTRFVSVAVVHYLLMRNFIRLLMLSPDTPQGVFWI